MNAAEQTKLSEVLHGRHAHIAECWYKAIAESSFSPLRASEVRQHFSDLTEQVISLLLSESLEHRNAQAIGTALACLHYTQPEALGRTQEVLANQLIEGLPANQVAALQPRLTTLLAHLAVGFCQQISSTILSHQEQIRLAVTSELQRLQESLHDERNFVSAILDTAGALVLVTDKEGRIARFNQACAQTTGYSFDEVKGRHSWDVLAIPESVETVKSFFRRLQDGDLEGYRLPNEAEQYVLTKDGDRRLIAWSYTGLPNSEGMIEYIISTGIDITEQSKMAKALRESEEKLRAQYKGIPIPTYTWQREGNDFVLVDCNDAAFEITQGLVVNLIGITASELHQDTPEVQEDLARCYTEMTPIEREMSYEFKTTGETRQLAVKYAFVPPDLVLVHIEDITERKQAQMHLIQADKMASMAVMAGAITHELHNPLSIISLYAQVLRDRPDDPQVYVQCAQKIHEMTQRASKIIDNLVRFARPENDLMMETDLNAILEETLPLVTHLMSSQQVVLHQKLDPDLPSVFGNPALLQQVFTNLILNACNAMPDGGALTIHSRRASEGEVQVSFTDTGRGIPPEDLPKIFDPFFTTMPMGRGTGLGLSVSYSILQMHQGAINVESDVGRGATVSVRLPAMDGLKANREKNNA